jgi:diacylglycerol kinase family enzyme
MTTRSAPDTHDPATGERAEPATPKGGRRLRGAMIVNPYSSGMTSRREREIVAVLRESMDLDVRRTERGGHAPKLARDLMESGNLDVMIACGGDGTANEVLNGMNLGDDTADARPKFAIIPAGGTNVLARSIGYPNHPVRATSRLAEAIVEGRCLRINLATVDERVFMFAAGVGLDAEVVKRMEQRRSGRRPSDMAHLAAIVGIYATSRWALEDRMTVTVDGTGEQLRSALVLVGNTTPMTYMGRTALHFMPECTLDGGLDFIAPQRVNALFAMRNAAQAMGVGRAGERLVSAKKLQRRHDVAGLTITCDEPQPVQVDGEFIGDRTHIRFGMYERAIDLVT